MLKSRAHRERSQTQHALEQKAYEEAQKRANGTYHKEQEELKRKAEEDAKQKVEEEAAEAERLALEKKNRGFFASMIAKKDPKGKGKNSPRTGSE